MDKFIKKNSDFIFKKSNNNFLFKMKILMRI